MAKQRADLMLVNKCDLLPHVDFDLDRAGEFAHRVNPGLAIMRVSARSGEGMEDWLAWIAAGAARAADGRGP